MLAFALAARVSNSLRPLTGSIRIAWVISSSLFGARLTHLGLLSIRSQDRCVVRSTARARRLAAGIALPDPRDLPSPRIGGLDVGELLFDVLAKHEFGRAL